MPYSEKKIKRMHDSINRSFSKRDLHSVLDDLNLLSRNQNLRPELINIDEAHKCINKELEFRNDYATPQLLLFFDEHGLLRPELIDAKKAGVLVSSLIQNNLKERSAYGPSSIKSYGPGPYISRDKSPSQQLEQMKRWGICDKETVSRVAHELLNKQLGDGRSGNVSWIMELIEELDGKVDPDQIDKEKAARYVANDAYKDERPSLMKELGLENKNKFLNTTVSKHINEGKLETALGLMVALNKLKILDKEKISEDRLYELLVESFKPEDSKRTLEFCKSIKHLKKLKLYDEEKIDTEKIHEAFNTSLGQLNAKDNPLTNGVSGFLYSFKELEKLGIADKEKIDSGRINKDMLHEEINNEIGAFGLSEVWVRVGLEMLDTFGMLDPDRIDWIKSHTLSMGGSMGSKLLRDTLKEYGIIKEPDVLIYPTSASDFLRKVREKQKKKKVEDADEEFAEVSIGGHRHSLPFDLLDEMEKMVKEKKKDEFPLVSTSSVEGFPGLAYAVPELDLLVHVGSSEPKQTKEMKIKSEGRYRSKGKVRQPEIPLNDIHRLFMWDVRSRKIKRSLSDMAKLMEYEESGITHQKMIQDLVRAYKSYKKNR